MSDSAPEDGGDRDRLLTWVERIANHLAEVDSVPLITGRILGWLMVCDPEEQSAGEIAEAISASRGSMTTNLRQLIGMGFVQRITRPGERTAYYRLVDDAWQAVVRRQTASLAVFREIAADGVDLLGAANSRSRRVREAHDLYEWLGEVLSSNTHPHRKKAEEGEASCALPVPSPPVPAAAARNEQVRRSSSAAGSADWPRP